MAETCARPTDLLFYEHSHYLVGRIVVTSPFDFLHLVRRSLRGVKKDLALREGGPFTEIAYNQSAQQVAAAVTADSVFGATSPLKTVLVMSALQNCVEHAGGSDTVDIVYTVFTTDPPLPGTLVTMEERQRAIEKPATTVAAANTLPSLSLEPLIGYDHTNRLFGGGEVESSLPGRIPLGFKLVGVGSSTKILLDAQMNLTLASHLAALNTSQYHLGYHYVQMPAHTLPLAEGSVYASFIGTTNPVNTTSSQIAARYGASIERGVQQSNHSATSMPANILANSTFGAFRFYGGISSTTRYSAIAASYGLEVAGTALTDPGFTKHIGNLDYNDRFPGSTHRPWDVEVRVSGGGITGSHTLLNERFFGGGAVASFIPGDSWSIPNGPAVRSIAPNLLLAAGSGGTSFYSTNVTVGKVVLNSPLIPESIERVDGFASGIAAAEDTAQGFFADGYETASPEFQNLTLDYNKQLKSEVDAIRSLFLEIKNAGTMNSELRQSLEKTDNQAHLAQNFIRNVGTRDKNGLLHAAEFKSVNNPTSRFKELDAAARNLQPMLAGDFGFRLADLLSALEKTLDAVKMAIQALEDGQAGRTARARAAADMARPRETIDTLRNEANSVSLGILGIFDSGRMWPDTYGTRYGLGAGLRLSVVNVNFNLGYAVNPDPQRQVGQGRGALFLSLTYTNLFR